MPTRKPTVTPKGKLAAKPKKGPTKKGTVHPQPSPNKASVALSPVDLLLVLAAEFLEELGDDIREETGYFNYEDDEAYLAAVGRHGAWAVTGDRIVRLIQAQVGNRRHLVHKAVGADQKPYAVKEILAH